MGLKHDSLQDIRSVLRGLRLIKVATSKVAGISEMDHESAMDFEAAARRLGLPFS
jgi:hypothetical protein